MTHFKSKYRGLSVYVSVGKYAEFRNHRFKTDDKAIITRLRAASNVYEMPSPVTVKGEHVDPEIREPAAPRAEPEPKTEEPTAKPKSKRRGGRR